MLVARFAPGTHDTETGPARWPLELFRCVVCYSLVERDCLEPHWNQHRRTGEVR